MPVSGGGFEQTHTSQAVVDPAPRVIMARHGTQQTNNTQPQKPARDHRASLPQDLGEGTVIRADSGYARETNVLACANRSIPLYSAVDREGHNQPLLERFHAPPPFPNAADDVTKLKHRLKTQAGKAVYTICKRTVEPVFGISNAVMGFARFMRRGFDSAQGEWNLVCMAYNRKRLRALTP